MLTSKKKHKGPSLSRDKATEYQQRLLHTIGERDRIRGECNEEQNAAKHAHNKMMAAEFQSAEQKRHKQVYDRHAEHAHKLRERIKELEEHMKQIKHTLEKGGYEVNERSGRITPIYHN